MTGKTTSKKLFTIRWQLHNSQCGKIDCFEDNPVWAVQIQEQMARQMPTVTSLTVDDVVTWTKKDGWLDSLFLITLQDALSKTVNISPMDAGMHYAPYMPIIKKWLI